MNSYFLNVIIEQEGRTKKQKIPLNNLIVIGNGDDAHFKVGTTPLCLKFRLRQGVPTVICTEVGENCYLGSQQLETGKMYILEKEDKITLGKAEIVLKQQEEQEEQIEQEEEPKSPSTSSLKPSSTTPPMPEFLTRTMAFVCCVILVLIIDFYILPLFQLNHLWESLNKETASFFLEKMNEWELGKGIENSLYGPMLLHLKLVSSGGESIFFDFLRLTIIFCSVDLISHLLLGTNLPLFICGVEDQGGLFWGRIRALFRSVIGWFTFSAIIYDLPLLVGKRSLKEVLTKTRLYYSNKFLRFAGPLLILPLAIAVPLALPFITHVEDMQSSLTLVDKKVPWTQEEGRSIASFSRIPMPPEVVIIPSIKIKNGEVSLQMVFYDQKKKDRVAISEEKPIDLTGPIKNITTLDPLLKYTDRSFYRAINANKYHPATRDIILQSLGISLAGSKKFLQSRGIFVGPYLKLKKHITTSLTLSTEKKHSVIRSPENTSLQIRGANKSYYIIPLKRFKLPVYRLTYDNKKSKLLKKITRHIHLADSFSLRTDVPNTTEQEAGRDPYNIAGILQRVSTPSFGAEEQKTIIYFFMGLGRESVLSQNSELPAILQRELKRIDLSLKKIPALKELNLSLNLLQKAIEEENESFFMANNDKK